MKKYKLVLLGLAYIFVFFLFLEYFLKIFDVPKYIFPSPSGVVSYIWEHGSMFFQHAKITLLETFTGVFLAFIVGIIFGGVFLYFHWIEFLVFPIIFILQIIPLVAISPIIILWFGFGFFSKIWIVFIFALYPILSFFKNGLENVDPEMIHIAHLLKANKRDIFTKILFPFCLLNAILGLKIALTYSLTSAIVAEFLGSSEGLGILLVRSLSSFNSLALFGNIYIIIGISMLMYMVASYFEKVVKGKLGLKEK